MSDDGNLQIGVQDSGLSTTDSDDSQSDTGRESSERNSGGERREDQTPETGIDSNREQVQSPFDDLPPDLNRGVLSESGATEFLSINPDELYRSTVTPYKFNRNGAHDQRKQDGLFVREPVKHGLDQIHTAMSHLYAEETYYRADTMELLLLVAFRHVDELPDVAADLGFGMDLNQYFEKRNK